MRLSFFFSFLFFFYTLKVDIFTYFSTLSVVRSVILENISPSNVTSDSNKSSTVVSTHQEVLEYVLLDKLKETQEFQQDSDSGRCIRKNESIHCHLPEDFVTRQNTPRYLFSAVFPESLYEHLHLCDSLQPGELMRKHFLNESLIGKYKNFSKEKSDIEPFTEYMKMVKNGSDFWPYAGLYEFSAKTYQMYSYLKSFHGPKWYFKLILSDKSLRPDSLEVFTLRVAALALQMNKPFEQSVCDAINAMERDTLCPSILNYTPLIRCHDRFADEVSNTAMCERLSQPNLGLSLSSTCQATVSALIHLKLNLDPVHDRFGETPVFLHEDVVESEKFTYFWIDYALQKLTRWTDLHRFCLPLDEEFPSEAHQDIELIPKWKSLLYFYHKQLNTKALPFAVLAEYEEDSSPPPPHRPTPQKTSETRLLLVIRDARTSFESFITTLTKPSRLTNHKIYGSAHEGYSALAAALGTHKLNAFIKEKVKNISPHGSLYFTVATEGRLGTGVALAVLQNIFHSFNVNSQADAIFLGDVRIFFNFVSFSGGYSADSVFLKSLSHLVNMRHIVEKNQAFDFSSCVSSLVCEKSSLHYHGRKSHPVLYHTIHIPGRIEFELPEDDDTLNRLFDSQPKSIWSRRRWLQKKITLPHGNQCVGVHHQTIKPRYFFRDLLFSTRENSLSLLGSFNFYIERKASN